MNYNNLSQDCSPNLKNKIELNFVNQLIYNQKH